MRPKKQEPAKLTGPIAVETWVPEEDLELWEIRAFAERLDMHRQPSRHVLMDSSKGTVLHPDPRCYRLEREKSQGVDSSKTGGALRTAEEVKAHLENQLKQARLAAQQVGTLVWFYTPLFRFKPGGAVL